MTLRHMKQSYGGLSVLVLAATAGCGMWSNPNPVGTGQQFTVNVTFGYPTSPHLVRSRTVQIQQVPARFFPDLPHALRLTYSTSYAGTTYYSGSFTTTAPTTPGSATITAKSGQDSQSVLIVVQ